MRVDGLSLEWAGVPALNLLASRYIPALGTPSGDADVSASVRSQWDDQNLYVLVHVRDDALVNDSPLATLWEDDSVELYLDGRSERATSYDANDFQLTVRIDHALGGVRSNQAAGVVYAVAGSSGGYAVEYAVPFSLLGIGASTGALVGYDIGVNDDDTGGARDTQLMLQGDGNGWRNPSVFGRLRLTTPPTAGGGSVRGDLNGDARLTYADLRVAFQMIVNLVPADMAKADLNGDGKLSLVDLRVMMNLLLGR